MLKFDILLKNLWENIMLIAISELKTILIQKCYRIWQVNRKVSQTLKVKDLRNVKIQNVESENH
jgi:hypothetical protein